MPNPTVSIGFSPTIPAPDSGYQNAIPRGDSGAPLLRESFEVPNTGGVSVKTASYTATAADCGKILSFADSSPATGHTLTLPSSPPFAQWRISVQNTGSSTLTINRNGKLIDGATTGPTLAHDSGMDIATDGTNYFTERGVAGTGGGGGGGGAMNFTGAWSLGTAYAVGDVASYNGSLYLRIVAGGSVGTPTVVQSAALMHTAGVAFPSNVTAGNLLVVAVSQETTAPPAPTDTLGTVYTLVSSRTGVNCVSIYKGIAPSSGANTVTSPNVSFSGTSISEITNVNATVNATSNAYFNATPASAPITTTAAGCLIYAAIAGDHNANTFTALTGFTLTAQANGSDAIAGETGFASTPGTYTPGFNETDGIVGGDTNMPIAAVAFTSAAITPNFDAANWDVFWEGVPGAATATSSTLGIVKPDNLTITIDGAGKISAVGGGGGGVPNTVHGLYVWCDASQLTGYSNGDPVNSWLNLAGGPALSVSGTAPTYQTGVLNSLPVIRFGGAGYFYSVVPEIIQAREVSLFFVLKISNLSQAYTGLFVGFTGATFQYLIKSSGKTAFYTGSANYDGTGAATLNTSTFYVMSLVVGPVGMATRVALAADASSSSTGFQSVGTGTILGSLANDTINSTRFLSGDIAEFIVYRRGLSTSEVSTIENYLKTKYGL